MATRVFDLIVASLGLLVLAPVLVILAAMVKLSSPGPVFYRAQRVGQHGKHFSVYKFRSMVVEAARRGPGITIAGDPRITSLGKWLRRHKLDELPQLFNVLLGDMSLVGPRPEDPRYVALYSEEQRGVLTVLPGITSPASVVYRNEESLLAEKNWETVYTQEILPRKLAIELDYIRNKSVAEDIKVILQTIAAIIGSDGPRQT